MLCKSMWQAWPASQILRLLFPLQWASENFWRSKLLQKHALRLRRSSYRINQCKRIKAGIRQTSKIKKFSSAAHSCTFSSVLNLQLLSRRRFSERHNIKPYHTFFFMYKEGSPQQDACTSPPRSPSDFQSPQGALRHWKPFPTLEISLALGLRALL